jgi:hypothetical protein
VGMVLRWWCEDVLCLKEWFLKGGGSDGGEGERLEVQDLKKYKRGDGLVC